VEAYAHIDEARIIYRMPNLHVSQYSMSKPQLRALRVSYPVFAPRDAPCYGSRFRVGFPRECLRALLVTVGGVGEACLSHLHAGTRPPVSAMTELLSIPELERKHWPMPLPIFKASARVFVTRLV